MAKQILDDDDLPTIPKVFTPVRIACTPAEEAMAQLSSDFTMSFIKAGLEAPSDWQMMPDEEFVTLAMEPEFLVECTPLERELIVRLSARLEYEKQPDSEHA